MYQNSKRYTARRRASSSERDVRVRIARTSLWAFGVILILRLFTLQIVDAGFYQSLASEQREVYRDLFPERGSIYLQDVKTNELVPLATNKDLYLVYADPRLITNPNQTAKKIASLLGIENIQDCGDCKEDEINAYDQLVERLSKEDDPYEPIKHGVEEEIVKEIEAMNLIGIDSVREAVRYYPLNNIGSHVSGFVGYSDSKRTGLYGIEGAFNEDLEGKPGFFKGEWDVGGRWIPVGSKKLEPAINGSDIVLTIDRTIEHMACSRLNEMVEAFDAKAGTVIIMEVQTGAILAMCGAPDFDSNNYSEEKDVGVFQNLATIGQYEPGSIFKVITMASALDAGAVTPETTYNDTGEVKIGNYIIKNSDLKSNGVQTMTDVLVKSLNTGVIFAAQKVGREAFKDYVERFGFGEKTGIEIRQEALGDMSALDKKGDIYLATASFGQGISMTPIQMVQAVGAIANKGAMMKPYMIKEIRNSNGAVVKIEPKVIREVITPRTATLLSGMMASVVEGTHGKRAGVPGYYVAGKTGTAQIAKEGVVGYEEGSHIGSFVGFAPVENPKFVMLTRIDEPKGVRFAESSAAPLFGDIAKFLLQYFEVKPTRPIN